MVSGNFEVEASNQTVSKLEGEENQQTGNQVKIEVIVCL
jgi:hypothetical protein